MKRIGFGTCLYSKSVDRLLKYQDYKTEDFIMDLEFRSWVTNPGADSNLFWENWIARHPKKIEAINAARNVILSMGLGEYPPPKHARPRVWEAIEKSMHHNGRSESRTIPLNSTSVIRSKLVQKKKRVWSWVGVAASLLLVGAASLLFFPQIPIQHDQFTQHLEPILKENPRGQKSTIILPDGSKIILNAESSLSYYPNFEGTERIVQLTGEAFFEVVKDTEKPFVVKTSKLTTTALGTSFNVNAYPGETEEVLLLTGKVKVIENESPKSKPVILLPNEEVLLEQGRLVKYKNVDQREVKWKEGIIVFQATPFEEGILKLERWYGVKFDIKNLSNDSNTNFTGTFENDNLSNVLLSLSYVMRFDYQIDGKSVTINFK